MPRFPRARRFAVLLGDLIACASLFALLWVGLVAAAVLS